VIGVTVSKIISKVSAGHDLGDVMPVDAVIAALNDTNAMA
jgi:hypothetical protein